MISDWYGQNMHCLIFHFICNMNSDCRNMNTLIPQVPATGTERLPSVRATARRATMSAAEMTVEMVNIMIMTELIMSMMKIMMILMTIKDFHFDCFGHSDNRMLA